MEKKGETNFFDVLVQLINGIFNLFKVEKIVCLIILYLLGRDYYIIHKIGDNADIRNLLIDTRIIEKVFQNDNTLIVAMGALIVVLLAIILIFIFLVRPMYVKEIERLSEVRKELIHGISSGKMKTIKKHRTSKSIL